MCFDRVTSDKYINMDFYKEALYQNHLAQGLTCKEGDI